MTNEQLDRGIKRAGSLMDEYVKGPRYQYARLNYSVTLSDVQEILLAMKEPESKPIVIESLEDIPNNVKIQVEVPIANDIAIREVYDKWKDSDFARECWNCETTPVVELWNAIKKYCEEE